MQSFEIFLLLSACLFSTTFLYLLSCVDPKSKGLAPIAQKLLFSLFPNRFLKYIDGHIGTPLKNKSNTIKNYLQNTNNAIGVIMYFFISVGVFGMFCWVGVHRYMPNRYVTSYNVCLNYVIALCGYWSYFVIYRTKPGKIDGGNVDKYVERFQEYYDGVLYNRLNKCSTCQIIKPARSKHCKLCGYCIPKFDHDCMWIRGCVGENNYKQFLIFVLVHAVWGGYLFVIAIFTIYDVLDIIGFWQMEMEAGIGINVWVAFQYVLLVDTAFFMTTLICLAISVVLTGFFFYHLWLISENLTTNQHIKFGRQIKHLKRNISKNEKAIEDAQDQQYNKKIYEIKNKKTNNKQNTKNLQSQQATNAQKLASIARVSKLNKGFLRNIKQVIFRQKTKAKE